MCVNCVRGIPFEILLVRTCVAAEDGQVLPHFYGHCFPHGCFPSANVSAVAIE